MTNRKIQSWVIPPDADGEYVACMEDVLEVYHRPYDEKHPVVCMDEQPVQLLKERRAAISATRNHPRRIDYEYERAGTVSLFMFAEPLSAWREVRVRERRTKIDWAHELERLLTGRYAEAEKILLVCDNLNTHTRGAFYEAFGAGKARSLVERMEVHPTPKHGSWLNIAENELSAMTRQALKGRRFGTIDEIRGQTKAWSASSNAKQRGVNRQFTIGDARRKLRSLYPSL